MVQEIGFGVRDSAAVDFRAVRTGSETTWEGIGVTPDVAARAPDALGVAPAALAVGDIYELKLANGWVYWAIALDSRGRIVMWEARLASRP